MPDYLYKRDRRGYNIYAGSQLGPEARLTIGRVDERQLADNRSNTSNYVMLTYDRDFARKGRIQIFNNLRRVQDNIRDDVIEWVVRDGSRGAFVPYTDPLPLRDGWANTVYLGYQYNSDSFRFKNRVKWEVVNQSDYDARSIEEQDIRESASFFGVLNKLDYTFDIGIVKLQPRIKSEFQRSRPSLKEDSQVRIATTELSELFSLIARVPILARTEMQTGVEYLFLEQFREELEDNQLRSDRTELVYALQFTNNVDYQGYNLWTQAGFRVARIDRASAEKARTETAMFVTVYAGLE